MKAILLCVLLLIVGCSSQTVSEQKSSNSVFYFENTQPVYLENNVTYDLYQIDTKLLISNETLYIITPERSIKLPYTDSSLFWGTAIHNGSRLIIEGDGNRIWYYTTHPIQEKKSPITFEQLILDTDITAGTPFTRQVTCNYKCTFADDTVLFDIDAGTGIISYVPDPLDAGIHEITISATDGRYTAQYSFTLNVSCGNARGCWSRPEST